MVADVLTMTMTTAATAAKPVRRSPLKVDPATDKWISQGAHFLGLTKKDMVLDEER